MRIPIDPEAIVRRMLSDLGDPRPPGNIVSAFTHSPALAVFHLAELAKEAAAWRARADRAEAALMAIQLAATDDPDAADLLALEIAPRIAACAAHTRAKP